MTQKETKNDIIFNLIKKEQNRQIKTLGLIASENFVSDNVLKCAGSILTNKYSEGYPMNRYYAGCKFVDEIENIAINRAKDLFKANYINVQPHSGSQANLAVLMACLNPGDTILGFNISHGGHLSHGAYVNFSGIIYKSFFYGVKKETGLINYDQMKYLANKKQPKLIICGASSYSRDIDYCFFKQVADSINALLLADISHTAGLIVKGLLNNPIKHCHVVTTTTHKTLRGPRGGLIIMGKDFEFQKNQNLNKMSNFINRSVFPGTQGGALQHIISAKAVAFEESLSNNFLIYAKNIIRNAKLLSKELQKMNYNVISGGTDNHCLLIDLNNKNITGLKAQTLLEKSDIICNKNMIPFDDKNANITSGIRIGSAGITTRGLSLKDVKKIPLLIHAVLSKNKSYKEIKLKINNMMNKYPLFNKQFIL